jgi:hypothetical protein
MAEICSEKDKSRIEKMTPKLRAESTEDGVKEGVLQVAEAGQ